MTTPEKNFVMTDSTFSHIQYKRIMPSDIFPPIETDSSSASRISSLVMGLFSVEVFPPSGDEIRIRTSVVSRDLCGFTNQIYEGRQTLSTRTSTAHFNSDIPLEVTNPSTWSSVAILFEIDLTLDGTPLRHYWIIYPITHINPQIKRLRFRESLWPFMTRPVMEHMRCEPRDGPSCFVYFSLRELESPSNISPRITMTPLNLTPRDTESVIDMHSINEWAKSWIGSGNSTQASSSGINISDMKSRIISQVMSRYSRWESASNIVSMTLHDTMLSLCENFSRVLCL